MTSLFSGIQWFIAAIWFFCALMGGYKGSRLYRQQNSLAYIFVLLTVLSVSFVFVVLVLQPSSELIGGLLSAMGLVLFVVLSNPRLESELGRLTELTVSEEEQRQRIENLVEHVYEGIYVVDPETFRYLDVNTAGAKALQYRPKELVGTRLDSVHRDESGLVQRKIQQTLESGKRVSFNVNAYRKDGRSIFVEIALKKVTRDGKEAILAVGRDLTRWQKSQKKIELANRLYALLTESNRAIIRQNDLQKLFNQICQIAVTEGAFKLAWVGRVVEGKIEPICRSGENHGYIESVQIDLNKAEHRIGPTAQSIQQKRVIYIDHINSDQSFEAWRVAALSRGFASMASMPIICSGRVEYVFLVYSGEAKVFNIEMKDLMFHLSEDLSYALTNLKAQDEKLAAEKKLRQLSSAVDQSADAVTIMNTQGQIEYVNPRFTEITGYAIDEVRNRSPKFLCYDDQECQKYDTVLKDLARGRKWHGEFRYKKKSGEFYWSMETISLMRDERGEITHYVSTAEDCTALKHAQEKIEQLAFYDPLTGLPNRRLLHDRLQQAFAESQRFHTRVAILFLDIDKFKSINDSMGHDIGDELLKQISQRLKDTVRKADTVARLGGDEFTVVLNEIRDMGEALHLAEKVLMAVQQPLSLGGQGLRVTTSIGITLYPDDGEDINLLLRNADMAMYHAKAEGRNNFQFYTDEMNRQAVSQLAFENKLSKAVTNSEFLLYYQPQMNSSGTRMVGMEALIRWRDGDKLVPPDQFIPIAEETGLMEALGGWVIEQACHDLKQIHKVSKDQLSLAINISASQFENTDQLSWKIRQSIEKYHLPPNLIEVELTESMLVTDVEATTKALGELKRLGISMAIDDFGTGYSSLSYLNTFPIDKLKIDRSFVAHIETDSNAAALAEAIIAMGHKLGLEVLAEGVETTGQLSFLRQNGCDFYQGYLFNKPQPIEELLKIIA